MPHTWDAVADTLPDSARPPSTQQPAAPTRTTRATVPGTVHVDPYEYPMRPMIAVWMIETDSNRRMSE